MNTGRIPALAAIARLRTWLVALVATALLVTLAVLQYRWTGEVAELERDRLLRGAMVALERFASDFDREISRLAGAFLREPAEDTRLGWQRWRDEAQHPELLAAVLSWDGEAALPRRYDPATDGWTEVPWPDGLSPSLLSRTVPRFGPRLSVPMTWGDPPALILPQYEGTDRPISRARGAVDTDAPAAQSRERLVLVLDATTLKSTVLPALAERYFASDPPEYTLEIRTEADGKETAFWSGTTEPVRDDPDAPRVGLLRLRPFPDMIERDGDVERPPFFDRRDDGPGREATPWLRRRGPPGRGPGEGFGRAPWTLIAHHRAGSLDRAVERLRTRNLLLSSGILSLLAAATALLVIAARRAQDTARRQLEWVAGLTHELHTPLAALSAAGENLADGVVQSPEKVREYGGLIRREGRRLQELVAQSLTLARLNTEMRAFDTQPVSVPEVLQRVVQHAELQRREAGAEIELHLPEGLPPVAADRSALERIAANLIDNALKYGGRHVRIAAALDARSKSVLIEVADDGGGLSPLDRRRLFDPFYRGARARERTAPGSGLGLHLVRRMVRAMRGEVDAPDDGADGAGTRLRVRLPIWREEETS